MPESDVHRRGVVLVNGLPGPLPDGLRAALRGHGFGKVTTWPGTAQAFLAVGLPVWVVDLGGGRVSFAGWVPVAGGAVLEVPLGALLDAGSAGGSWASVAAGLDVAVSVHAK